MDPAYSITSEPQPEPEKSTSDRVRELFGQSVGYLATAADEGLLGAPSFVARKIGVEDALKRVKELNPYKTSAEISGDIASMALPTGIPSKLAAGGAKLFGKILPKAAPFLTSKAAQILANSESLAKLRGLKGMAARGAVNAAWQSAPREAMKEQPEWGSVPLAATVGAVTGPVVGKVAEKIGSKLRIPKPEIPNKLSQKHLESILMDIDMFGPIDKADPYRKEAFSDISKNLKNAGIDYIDMYHVSDKGIKELEGNAIRGSSVSSIGESGGNIRSSSVYGFLDPNDIKAGFPGILGAKSETPNVLHIKVPVNKLDNFRWDGNFNLTFGTYSGIRFIGDIPISWIAGSYKMHLPSE